MRARLAGALLVLLPVAVSAQERSDLVYLRDIDPSIRQDMRYAGYDNFTGRPLPGYRAAECMLRRPAALALKRVQADLAPHRVSLKVYDCYRPTRAVAGMARWASDAGARPDTSRFFPALKKNQLFALGYIAPRSAHSRGVAIDLTLVPLNTPRPAPFDPTARYGPCTGPASERAPDDSLDMGTGYDCFDTKSHTHNTAITAQQRAHREQLLEAMTRRGFVNYPKEWWHFSFPAADTGAEFDFPIDPR